MSPPPPTSVDVGHELEPLDALSTLATSVRYAGASGDFNPLHFDPATAAGISPTGGVIAHGMYSMGLASRVLTRFAGGPGRVLELDVRFTRPWPLGTTTTFGGTVTDVTDDEIVVKLHAVNSNGNRVLRGTGRVRR